MVKYDERFKLAVVQDYLDGTLGHKAVAHKHRVGSTKVRAWVHSYAEHGIAGLRKKFSHYSAEFKLSVLKKMWQDELSLSRIATLFDIRGGPGVVSAWERLYHQGGLPALQPKARGRPKKMTAQPPPKSAPAQPSEARTLEELRKENEYLRAEVAYLKKLQTLVQDRPAAPKKRKPSSS